MYVDLKTMNSGSTVLCPNCDGMLKAGDGLCFSISHDGTVKLAKPDFASDQTVGVIFCGIHCALYYVGVEHACNGLDRSVMPGTCNACIAEGCLETQEKRDSFRVLTIYIVRYRAADGKEHERRFPGGKFVPAAIAFAEQARATDRLISERIEAVP